MRLFLGQNIRGSFVLTSKGVVKEEACLVRGSEGGGQEGFVAVYLNAMAVLRGGGRMWKNLEVLDQSQQSYNNKRCRSGH